MEPARIPIGRNLATDGAASRERRIPLLLFFSQEHCGYCERLEEEVLTPMVISGEYEDRVILRKLSIDYGEDVTGFDGRKVDNRMLFHEYDGIVTPTLVLADHSGQPLTKPLVGINTVEFFGWYLDQAIDSALTRLRTPVS